MCLTQPGCVRHRICECVGVEGGFPLRASAKFLFELAAIVLVQWAITLTLSHVFRVAVLRVGSKWPIETNIIFSRVAKYPLKHVTKKSKPNYVNLTSRITDWFYSEQLPKLGPKWSILHRGWNDFEFKRCLCVGFLLVFFWMLSRGS